MSFDDFLLKYILGLTDTSRMEGGWDFSWSGNTSENVKNIYFAIASLKSINDCGDYEFFDSAVQFDQSESAEWIHMELKLAKVLSPYHICCKVVPPKLSQTYPLLQMKFGGFGKTPLVSSFQILLADQVTASYFSQHQTMLGDGIVTTDRGTMVYRVQIKEYDHTDLKNDPKHLCVDYKVKGEYGKCIEDEIMNDNYKYINCTPPWMTDNEDLWCKGTYNLSLNKIKYENYLNLIELGRSESKTCLVPCKLKQYQAKEIGAKRTKRNKGFIIRFENEVEIIKSSWQLDEITFLANIGGFIGVGKEFLWLVIMTISSVGMFISYVKKRK